MNVQNDDLQQIEMQLQDIIYRKQKGDYVGAAGQIISLANTFRLDESDRYFDAIVYYMDLLDYLIREEGEIIHMNTLVRMRIIDYFFSMPYEEIPGDMRAPLEFVIKKGIAAFPDEELEKHFNDLNPVMAYDEKINLFYIIHNGKKLYFSGDQPEYIMFAYKFLCMEQHINSPHRYVMGDFDVKEGDRVLDVGAAEANFSLDAVEKSSKLYIFEADQNWRKALEETFRPWKEKVNIISKFASDQSDENSVTIDEIIGDEQVDFIKIDVEGEELSVLRGADRTLHQNPNIKLAVCTYHKPNDAAEIKEYLENMGFAVEFSKGYMIFGEEELIPPYFRKGLIRAVRRS